MNCANHPDTPVAAYCQFCGKPLCDACVHRVNTIIACEPCLAARIGASPSGSYGVNIDDGQGFQYMGTGPLPPAASPQPGCCTEPWLAFCLGWIPGVGAMYNGQFAKALVHVFVFAVLVDISDNHGAFGILVAAWMFYQVFDAYQTTVARRDGLPLPNPLGLNDVGQWFGARSSSASTASTPGPLNSSQAGSPEGVPPTASYVAPPSMPAYPPDQVDMPELRRGVPTGAVVLIVIGVAFLLGNMGIFSEYWLEKSWPVLLIGIGVWLVIQRSQNPPPGGAR